MAEIGHVIACLDGSELGRGVVPHAQAISKAFHAPLTLLHVLETEPSETTSSMPADPLDWGIRRREARAHLREVAAALTTSDSRVRSELIHGRAAEQICHWADQNDVDLTVLCSHGSRGLTEWDLASTARKLIDRIPGSLLLVPAAVAAEDAEAEEVRYRRILVPLDGSTRAESVIPLALRIAAAQNAEVLFAHVVGIPEVLRIGLPDPEGSDLERRIIEHNRRTATAYLDRLRIRNSGEGSPVRSIVVNDDSIRSGLERLIRDERADLVVMSAHGRTGRLDTPCGSVTEYALTHACVPLLVVRERNGAALRRVAGQRLPRAHRPEFVGPSAS